MSVLRSRAKPIAAFLPAVIGEALAARGMGEASLVSHWPAIVGEAIAAFARPIELQWPARGPKRDPQIPARPATLVLRVDGAFALEAQHSAAIIVTRVNAHLGWRCVEKIAFRQGPLPPLAAKRQGRPAPSTEAKQEAHSIAARIEDEALREALAGLGARVLDQDERIGAIAPAAGQSA